MKEIINQKIFIIFFIILCFTGCNENSINTSSNVLEKSFSTTETDIEMPIEYFIAGEPIRREYNDDYLITPDTAMDLVINKLTFKNKLYDSDKVGFIPNGFIEYNRICYHWIWEYLFFEDHASRLQSYFVNAYTGEIFLDYDPTLFRVRTIERFPEFADIIEDIGEDDGYTRLIKID